ncbi:MAG: hypothetical protein M3N43_04890 [Actinomycetota bacterium]|nr:hypothetical protein [Actinomycetota bacterium]
MRWRTVRDLTMLTGGLGTLYHQIVITNTPNLWVLIVGFALTFLPSTLFAERMLSGKRP